MLAVWRPSTNSYQSLFQKSASRTEAILSIQQPFSPRTFRCGRMAQVSTRATCRHRIRSLLGHRIANICSPANSIQRHPSGPGWNSEPRPATGTSGRLGPGHSLPIVGPQHALVRPKRFKGRSSQHLPHHRCIGCGSSPCHHRKLAQCLSGDSADQRRHHLSSHAQR